LWIALENTVEIPLAMLPLHRWRGINTRTSNVF